MELTNLIRPLLCPWSWQSLAGIVGVLTVSLTCASVAGQQLEPDQLGTGAVEAAANQDLVKSGYLIDVPLPIDAPAAESLIRSLERLAESAGNDQRITVVLRYGDDGKGPASVETSFEDALKLARAITNPRLRQIKVVSYVAGEISGHATLPLLASESLIVNGGGVIGNASAAEETSQRVDPTVLLAYQSIAERRGLFAPAIVSALVDPELELAQVSKLGGDQVFAAGEELQTLRQSGQVLGESVWSAAGVPLRLNAKQLRTAQIALNIADSLDQAAETLDLAAIHSVAGGGVSATARGVLLEITGSIASNRAKRWQSNLASTLESGDINTWLVTIDSGGGNLNESATLAGWFARPEPPLQTVAGIVRGEARGDASLIALACKPLYLMPDSRLGGPGAETLSPQTVERYDELIEEIATSTKRPAALIRGLLDPSLVVYRYTNRKTGRIRYATEADLTRGVEDVESEKAKWLRGEAINLSNGLTASEAISLGLADGESRSVDDASRQLGLPGTPPPVSDRGIVRFVERIGASNSLAFLLLFIGFAAFSAEANAPGLGLPGFVALICFAMYFWMKFLAGTAEWLELLAFTLGIACIAIEVFIVPGFGVFGIGGLALTVLGIVLMSQTFVVPRNVYQIEILTHGVWVALGGAAGLVGGFLAMRMLLPHVPMFRGLVMEPVDQAVVDEAEKLGDYSHLLGRLGTATTPLRPSGKAKFGDQVVQVVSDGTAISVGDAVRVADVHATKVVVEPVEHG